MSKWQKIKRRISLHFRGSYVHPDGHLELDTDEKAGIRREDDAHTALDKFYSWQRKESEKQQRWNLFFCGALVGGAVVYWWLS